MKPGPIQADPTDRISLFPCPFGRELFVLWLDAIQGGAMRYALLICNDETEAISPDDQSARLAAVGVYAGQLRSSGVMEAGARLRPTSTATTVRVREGDLVIADGPFTETKEQIAGFFLVECEDLDEAIEIAAGIPVAEYGTIEVRPVWEV